MNPVTHVIYLNEQPGLSPFSGAENHLFILLRALVEHGVSVELLILLQNAGPQIEAKRKELEQLGIKTDIIPCETAPDRSATMKVRDYFLAHRNHIAHTHLDQADITGKLGAFLGGCHRIISTTHNQEMHHLKPKWFAMIHALDLITRRYIAITESVKDHMIYQEHLPGHKIVVIPYGVPTPVHTYPREELRQRLGIPQEKFVIGFVGRLSVQKNIPLLISAVTNLSRELSNLWCVIVGGGELAEYLTSLVREQNITNVRFLGPKTNAADLMPAFDILCLPSSWEGLGLVLIEAMQRHVPIIGSRAGAIPEVLAQGKAGFLFEAGDDAALAETIRNLYYHPDLRRKIANQAYQHVLDTYTVEQMTRKTLAVYHTQQ
jgi:glycosyltransferase involved in cell wall biosynthesis